MLIHRNKTTEKHNSMLDYQSSLGIKLSSLNSAKGISNDGKNTFRLT